MRTCNLKYRPSRLYVVTVEVYGVDDQFMGTKDVEVEETHCVLAAQKAETLQDDRLETWIAVDVRRK